MGNDDFSYDFSITSDELEKITLDLEEWDKMACADDYITVTLDEKYPWDDPIYRSVQETERELKEKQLREQHADLQAAYNEYLKLLEKYNFWDTLNK